MTPQVVIVTGASSGIGLATALHLQAQGHIVYGAARRVENMQPIVDKGGKAVALDVMKQASIEALVKQVIAEQGRIDVLFNNAGYAIYGAVEDITIDEARRQFEVNLFGLAAMTQAVLPHMRQQKSGKIINTSSIGGKIYTPLGAWYHATKHALEGWSDCLRLELAPFGIDVVIVEPGLIKTEFGEVMMQPMVDRSKGGAYEQLANSVAKATTEGYKTNSPSAKPIVIAKLVAKAMSAKRPKTRYSGGRMATMLLGMRRWLTDRMFDKAVMSQVRSMMKAQ